MIRAQNERDRKQSREQSQDPFSSEAERAHHGDVAMEAEFDADIFVQSFAQRSFDTRDAVIAMVAGRYVKNLQQFQAYFQEQGLADHPSIAATDIMHIRNTVQQVMAMHPFVQALRRKNEERRALEHSIVSQCSVSLPPFRTMHSLMTCR